MNKVYNYFTLPLTGITMLFWVVIPAIASPASAQTNEGLEPDPLAEQWILEKVARGEVADLEDMYPGSLQQYGMEWQSVLDQYRTNLAGFSNAMNAGLGTYARLYPYWTEPAGAGVKTANPGYGPGPWDYDPYADDYGQQE